MKSITTKQIARSLAGLGIALAGASAFAATTWSVDSCTTTVLQGSGSGCTVGTVGNTNSVHAYAYAVNTGTSSTFAAANLLQHGTNYGLGVQSGSETSTAVPDHTMDNNGYTELIAFKFDSAVILDKITLGWTQGDADFSLFAWTGSSAPTTGAITGKSLTGLASAWSLVGNYANTGGTTNPDTRENNIVSTVNAKNVSSSWWIISAYSSSYGGTQLDASPDYMKIMTIASKDAVTPPGGNVPEPGSLALLGAAMMGFVATRRRKSKAV